MRTDMSGKEKWSSQVSANGPSPAICAAGLRKFDAPHSPLAVRAEPLGPLFLELYNKDWRCPLLLWGSH